MAWLSTILDLIFPEKCSVCNKAGLAICVGCLAEFPAALRPTENWIFPLFDYRHSEVKRAIWLLKYKNKKGMAKVFGSAIYENILEELATLQHMENFTYPMLIPLPLSARRRKERGYNQAELVAQEVASLSGDLLELRTKVLVKTKNTERQAHIRERQKRLKNMAGSFAIALPSKVTGRNVIIIDDVTTTGATLREAKKVLHNCGAKKILAFTIAH